jgi:hypothetical protein
VSTFLRRYFGLGMLEKKVKLGPDESPRISAGPILWVLLMYVGVLLGVVSEYVLEAARSSGPDKLSISIFDFFKAWLVATLLFPLVCPTLFNVTGIPQGTGAVGDNAVVNRALRFFIAFQNGFFWQAVLM